MSKALIVVVAVIAVLFMALVYLWGPAPGSPKAIIEGVFVDSSSYKDFPLKGKGQKENVNLRFRVDNGTIITMTQKPGEPYPADGQKAAITYQMGRAFGNRVYLDYQWMK